jgi:hypothetical protein
MINLLIIILTCQSLKNKNDIIEIPEKLKEDEVLIDAFKVAEEKGLKIGLEHIEIDIILLTTGLNREDIEG